MHGTSVRTVFAVGSLAVHPSFTNQSWASSIAGVDTSTATFGSMLWELSRRVDVVQKLRAELDEVVPDRRTFPDFATLAKQPYLTAFLNEGMYARTRAWILC